MIRRATPADAERAKDIVFASLRSYGIEPDPGGLDADIFAFGAPKDGADDLVAEVDGVVAGICSLSARGPDAGWVAKLFVDARYRRRGLGGALLARVIDEGRARGYARLELRTRAIFREAVALYESTGWQRGADPPKEIGPDRTYAFDLQTRT